MRPLFRRSALLEPPHPASVQMMDNTSDLSEVADLGASPPQSKSCRSIYLPSSTYPRRGRKIIGKREPMTNMTPELPRKVALFSGHMIDSPSRGEPRFPPDREPIAARAIAEALTDLGVGRDDLAICGGACGGDLLFAEAALARGAHLELYIPFDEPTFLEKSVDFADRDWRARYFAVKAAAVLHAAPSDLGPLRDGEDAYERNNRWMLDSALRFGADKVDFVCLWNGSGGDGPGGTRHMLDMVRSRGGRTHRLDTTKLWG
jgi:hypothetical protein